MSEMSIIRDCQNGVYSEENWRRATVSMFPLPPHLYEDIDKNGGIKAEISKM